MRYYWHAIIACFAQGVLLASAVDISRLLGRRATGIPSPISVPPSKKFEGDDGPWSTFTIQVGTPPQTVRVLVSTAGEVTWTVVPSGCNANDLSCKMGRGGTFNPDNSSTWHAPSSFYLDIEHNLDYTAQGSVANDTLTLGTGGPTLKNQAIGGLVAKDFYLGMLGLNPRPTNFTTGADASASLMTSLKAQNLIPSMSLGYTAGNNYHTVFGSLTLGGYDNTRFTPNNVSFDFADNTYRDIVVGIQGISTGQSPDMLPDGGILAFVDSSVPHIWLPRTACQAFEKAFGLTYDDESGRYIVSSSTHTKLLNDNATITFTLGRTQSGGDSLNITLPYQSFDLLASWPEANVTGEFYFPLRRAANATQYTLGRTFLQEAYLIIDWERKNFSVSQCVFNNAALNGAPQLVAILPKDAVPIQLPSPTAAAKSSSPSTGEIAGIVAGVIVILALLMGGFAIFKLKQRRKKNHSPEPATPAPTQPDPSAYNKNQNEHTKGELATGREHERYELFGNDSASKSPSAAFVPSEKPSDFDGNNRSIGVKNNQAYVPELPTPDPDLSLPIQPVEMESPSLRPVAVELPTNETPTPQPRYGSPPDDLPDHGPSPPYRSATTSPIPHSRSPSPLSQPSKSPPTMHATGGPLRPGLHSRSSTLNSLPSIQHSVPSTTFPTGFSSPNRSSSISTPPVSPMAGALPESGLGISSVMGASGHEPVASGLAGHADKGSGAAHVQAGDGWML